MNRDNFYTRWKRIVTECGSTAQAIDKLSELSDYFIADMQEEVDRANASWRARSVKQRDDDVAAARAYTSQVWQRKISALECQIQELRERIRDSRDSRLWARIKRFWWDLRGKDEYGDC